MLLRHGLTFSSTQPSDTPSIRIPVTAPHAVSACPCAKRREGSPCLSSRGSPQRSAKSASDHETEFLLNRAAQQPQPSRGVSAMANREQRGNREKRKPKAEKPKPPVQISPFARPQGMGPVKSSASKKHG